MGIDIADLALYLNITFFSVLGLGMLFGLIKGFRRSLYSFIITLLFLGVFFLTVNTVVGYLYTAEIGFLNNLMSNFLPISGSVSSIQDAVHAMLSEQLDGTITIGETSEEALALIDSIGTLVLKIAYTVIYFTVFQIIFRFFFFIVSLFIFAKGRAKNKKGKRNRPMGAVFGTLTGALNLFVTLIVLSGLMSIAESLSDLQATQLSHRMTYEIDMSSDITSLDDGLERVGRLRYKEMSEADQQLSEALDMVDGIVGAYNDNFFIQALNAYQVEDEFTGENKNAAVILFDEVLSMSYKDEQINLRSDLIVFVDVAKVYLNSDYYANGGENLSDITSDEVGDVFEKLSKSKLLVSLIPVAIEVGIDYSEVDITIDKEMLYETIKWQEELEQIGVVATAAFMILEEANALDNDTDINMVSFSGSLTKDFFDELSESELAKYGAFIAISQAITASADSEMDLGKIIVVPETVDDWGSEFEAIGVIANEILSSGLTINDINTKDPLDLIAMLSDADLTKLLNSSIVTNAMINILSGQTDIDIDVEFLSIPDLTRDQWLDQLDQDGEVLVAGELRNILNSLSILVDKLDEIDIDDIGINDLTILNDQEIDDMFESLILVASITETIKTLDTGDFDLIIPDSVLDDDGYIEKEEVKRMFKAVVLVADSTACDPGDLSCEEKAQGIDINKALDLSDADIDKLFDSEILFATTSNLLGGFDEILVPEDIKISIDVEGSPLTIVNKDEVKLAIKAITALGVTDVENIEFDESLLLNLSEDPVTDPTTLNEDKTDALFASKLIHATISDFLIKATEPEPGQDAVIVVPYFASENYEGTTTNIVLDEDPIGLVTYITANELTEILQAILLLELSDFNNIEASLDISTLLGNTDELLDSAILHATISELLVEQTSTSDDLIVPDKDADNNDVFVTVGSGEEETKYIAKTELNAIFNALELLDIDDINNISLDTIDMNLIVTNDDALLASAILHATISYQMTSQAGTSDLVVPSLDLNNDPIVFTVAATEYIAKDEIKNALAAIETLGITDFTDVNVDASILRNLADDTDSTTLDVSKANAILGSKIIHATISNLMIQYGQPDPVTQERTLYVPYTAAKVYNSVDYTYNDDAVRFLTDDSDEYIVEAEIIELLRIVIALDIDDFESFNDSDPNDPLLGRIMPHKNILFNSAIIHATISDKIMNQDAEGLTIPDQDVDANDIIIEVVDASTASHTDAYISETELIATLDALDALDLTDFNSISIDTITLSTISDNDDLLLSSATIHATISQQIIDQSTNETLVLPFYDLDNNDIRVTVSGTEFILKDEIKNTLGALQELGIESLDNPTIDASILQNLGVEGNETELDTSATANVLASKIVHATISKLIIDASAPDELSGAQDILVPYTAETNYNNADYGYFEDEVRAYTTANTDEYIVEAELVELFRVVLALDITDFNSFNDNDPENPLLERILPHKNILFNSAIIQATISDKIIEQNGENLIVPNQDFDEFNIIVTKTDTLTGTHDDTYIISSELVNVLDALDVLDITDFNDVAINDFNIIIDNSATLLASAILHATISDKILAEGETEALTIPTYDLEENLIRKTVDTVEYINADEITATLDALKVLNITSFDGIAVDIGIIDNLAVDPEATPKVLSESKAETLFSSKIVHATLSTLIIDAGVVDEVTGTRDLIVPFVATESYQSIDIDYPNSTQVRVTILATDEYIVEAELTEMFEAILVLNIDSFGAVSTLTLTTIVEQKDQLLDSAILHATVSKQIFDLESTTDVVIPEIDEQSNPITIEDNTVPTDITTYLLKVEIKNLLDAIALINDNPDNAIGDITGTVELGVFLASQTAEYDDNQETLFASSIMKATVSKQVFNLEVTSTDILVPDVNQDGVSIIIPDIEGDGDAYLIKDELKALLNATDLVTNMNEISDFSGAVDLSNFFPSTNANADDNQNTLLSSSVMQATISLKIADLETLGNITIPTVDVLSAEVEKTHGSDYFIVRDEVKALINVMDLVGFSNIEQFDGVIDFSVFSGESNQTTLLNSAIMHRTVSKQIIENNSLDIPDQGIDFDDNITAYDVRTTVLSNEYLIKDEIKNLMNVMDLITNGSGDLTGFSATIDISLFAGETNQNTLLKSAVMHYTVSNQILNNNSLDIPNQGIDFDDNVTAYAIRQTVSANEYIVRDEVKALINVMNLVTSGSGNLTGFSASIDIGLFADSTNQDTLLSSAVMHYTVSNQIISNNALVVPELSLEADNVTQLDVRKTAGSDEYIVREEIRELINVMNLVTSGSLDGFSANFNLSLFAGETKNDPGQSLSNQSMLLKSSIMHATISDQIFVLDDANTLVAPVEDIDSNTIRITVSGTSINTEYLIQAEVRNLIDGMDTLGLGNQSISAFDGGLSLSNLSTSQNQDTVLSSATLHATFSDKLTALDSNVLVVPNYTSAGEGVPANQIRFSVSSVEFIDKTEVKAIIDRFISLGYGDLDSFPASIDSSVFFNNMTYYLGSASFHATISSKLISGAGGSNLIIPDKTIDNANFVKIVQTDVTYVLASEIENLVLAFDELNITDFSTGVSASVITTLNETKLEIIMDSGTMHLTIESFIQSNNLITIPGLAIDDLFGTTDILIRDEVIAFILATQVIANPGEDITSISFDFNAISSLTPTERNVVLESMIVRNEITPDIETAVSIDPFYTLDASDYMESNTSLFLTKQGILDYIAHLNP